MLAKMTLHLHCKTIIGQQGQIVIKFSVNVEICLPKRDSIDVKFTSFDNIAKWLPMWHCINVRKESSGNVDMCLLKWPRINIAKISSYNVAIWWNSFLVTLPYTCLNDPVLMLKLHHLTTLTYGCLINIAITLHKSQLAMLFYAC